jgi:cytochrome c oxidase assembly protein subunit 15
VFVGAMVTTRKAGLAVPDWPNTFGYNLFLYPLASWFAAPWNVFVEHGHRLFGALVGMLTIALLISLWLRERRAWVVWLGAVALVMVMGQGILGGMRVTERSDTMAQIHGCVGPLFFAMTVALCVLTSRLWQQAERARPAAASRRVQVLALLTTLLAYAQLIVGSQLRHVQAVDSAEVFRTAVWFHLVLAAAVLVHAVMLVVRIMRLPEKVAALTRPAMALAILVAGQIVLGGSTWLLKYGWPAALPGPQALVADWTNTAGAFLQSVVITAHVAVGSLIIGVALLITLRSLRLLAAMPLRVAAGQRMMEVAG